MRMRRLKADLETELIDVARHLADAAREATAGLFRSETLQTESKSADGWDPVTEADRRCELAMKKILSRRRPGDGVLGEEFGTVKGVSGLQWALDPIDGTRSFVSGVPVWGTLICVSDDDGPLYGIIDQPYIGERFEGGFGCALMRGPRGVRRLATRKTDELKNAILFTTFPQIGTGEERQAFERVSERALLTRYGLDCYSYALAALGQIDLVIEAGLKPYDAQAPIAVVSAAGGIVTDWRGETAHQGGRIIAAANKKLHEKALAALDWTESQVDPVSF